MSTPGADAQDSRCPECDATLGGRGLPCFLCLRDAREAFIRQASAQQKSDALYRYAAKLGAKLSWVTDDGVTTWTVAAGSEGFDVASEDEALELLQDIDKAGGVYDTSRVDFHRLRADVEELKAGQRPKREKDPWGLRAIFQAIGDDCDVDVFRESEGLRFEMRGARDLCIAVLEREKLIELVGSIRRWLACST